MLPQEIIRRKRDGAVLNEAEIAAVVAGIAGGGFSEAQVAAFAMAVFFRGMTRPERVALTQGMRDSGTVLRWDLPGPVLDKHSTGGVGDKVSLMLAPIVAACGGYVPMISGRGLGHTGGTLDKMAAIPGYQPQPDLKTFRRVVATVGCAIIGQTADLAPADKRFYAIRDVTATVESIPLICASILSKKLAAGLEGLAMDVKTGAGAFMPTLEAARELARSIVEIAKDAGLPTVALVTDMDEVLGVTAGNGLEVREAVDYLTGALREARLHEVTLALAGEMLLLGKLAGTAAEGRARAAAALDSGKAAEIFGRMVTALGGPADFLDRSDAYLPVPPVVQDFVAPAAGVLSRLDARAVGVAVIELGGGRRKTDDAIDLAVGFSDIKPVGARMSQGDVIARVHARDEAAAARALETLASLVAIDEAPAKSRPVIADRIG